MCYMLQCPTRDIRTVYWAGISWAQSPLLYRALTMACIDSEACYAPEKLDTSFIAEGHKRWDVMVLLLKPCFAVETFAEHIIN